MCRLKKHAYAELPPGENHASQAKSLHPNMRNSAFPRALARALTRILKTGVQDSHLAKSRSPIGKSGSPTPKKLESHQFVHTVYLFHFSRK